MSVLRKQVVEDTIEEVAVHYLSRQISSWWNSRRSPEDTVTFCGWYWVRGGTEAGPFRTRSAALRDAYYKFVIQQKLPKVWREDIPSSVLKTRSTVSNTKSKTPKRTVR